MVLDNIVDKEMVKVEMIMLLNKMMSMVNQTKKDLKMSRWIHMPKYSEEYKYYRLLCGNYEAFAYDILGMTVWHTDKGAEIAITHLKKARAIYNLVGMTDKANLLDTLISMFTAKKQSANDEDASSSTESNSVLGFARNLYEQSLHRFGIDSEDTIRSGLYYAQQLRKIKHCIEAERLATKLAMISRQVHGPEHNITIEAAELLELCKERYVFLLPDMKPFLALQYENDGEICVVTGPFTKPRITADDRIHRVQSNLIVPTIGCAVICHGLVSALHLNGRLGVVRDGKHDGTDIRCAVYFEKKGEQSALVKPENLRVAFELPDEK